MAWDPTVLRKYSSTSHFRLLNQVRTELNSHPLARHPDGEINLGLSRRPPSSRVPVEVRGTATKAWRAPQTPDRTESEPAATDGSSFRDRLRAIEMR